MKRIVELDGIRTIAVVSVVACHYAPFSNWFHQIPAHYGGLGVDIFFVLSGFLITTILLELKHSEHPYKIFYARRFLRIMPPYLLLLVIVYGIAMIVHDPIEPQKLIGQLLFLRSFLGVTLDIHKIAALAHQPHLIPKLFTVTVNKFVDRDYPILPITGSLGPTWSLSVEEWFYVLWAPVALLLSRRWIVAVGVAMCISGFLLRWFISPAAMIVRSADILIVGALLAIWIEHRRTLPLPAQRRYDRFLNVAGVLAAIAYVSLAVMHRELMGITLAEIAFAAAIGWLIRSAGAANPVCRLLRFGPLVYIGSISYTLYLIHLPMYFLVRGAILRMGGDMNEEVRFWIVSLSSFILSIVFSALSWSFYESRILAYKEPITRWIVGVPTETASRH